VASLSGRTSLRQRYLLMVQDQRFGFSRRRLCCRWNCGSSGFNCWGKLDCSGGAFKSGGGHLGQDNYGFALNAASCEIKGSVYFRKKIDRNVEIQGEVGFAFASVARDFQWRDLSSPKKATLDLKYAKVRTSYNERRSWPRALSLVGFVYEHIDSRASISAKDQF
jgi:hypothetical protein